MIYPRIYKLILFIVAVYLSFACSSTKKTFPKAAAALATSYAIFNVNIIPMTEGSEFIANATVIIQNKKIVGINTPVPSGAKRIDSKGKWLLPGLIDMHVHNLADINFGKNYPTKGASLFTDQQDFMLLYIASGVTTVFELSARTEHFGARNEVVKGKVVGPRMALAFLIDGGNGSGNIANSPEDGRQTVRIAKAQGYEFIKVYSGLNVETFNAIVSEAKKQGMKVVGHIPNAFRGKLAEAFIPGFDMVAHAEEFSKQSPALSNADAEHFALLAKKNGTWLTPTLTTMKRIAEQTRTLDSVRNLPDLKYVHPLMQSKWLTANNYNRENDPRRIARIDSMVEFHFRLVKAFKSAGVPLVAGTDAGVSSVIWGSSLHDELELLVQAGLTPQEALVSATRLPATWLGLDDKVGTVEIGKYADLILLDANPLDNINNMRKIFGVFVNGRWVSRKEMDQKLLDLEKKNAVLVHEERYDWKNRNNY